MKTMKKVLALVVAMMMIAAMSSVALAAGTGTITITPPEGTQSATTNTYKIYKVFDADGNGTNISYKLVSGKTTAPAGFSVDAAGNVTYAGAEGTTELTAADIAAIAAYVTEDDLVATATSTGTANAVASNLPNGYYYITTSTGSVVTIDSTNPNAEVEDKNVVPPVVKSAGTQYDAAALKAIAAVGTDQPFTAQITKTKGAKNLIFTDTMTNMTYNGDVVITVSEGTAPTAAQAVVTETAGGFKVAFDDEYIAGLKDNTVITLKYTGKVTSDALSVNPAKNTASLTYGDNNAPSATPPEVEVYNAKISVLKQNGTDLTSDNKPTPLQGAGFVLKNSEDKYYTLTTVDGVKTIVWVDKIDDADEHMSGADGSVPAFTGLADGTYTLEEKTVPAGFNKAADVDVTIAAGNYDAANLEQEKTIVNNKGTELPSTGGMGTTILYTVGGILVLGAAILLVVRRRVGAGK